jgi:hypothetical protein
MLAERPPTTAQPALASLLSVLTNRAPPHSPVCTGFNTFSAHESSPHHSPACTGCVTKHNRNSLFEVAILCGTLDDMKLEQTGVLLTETETFCTRKSPSFYPHERTVTPRYLSLSITDSVTSHCITLTLLGSTIKLQEPSQETRNWGLPARNTHHWLATPKPQTPQITTTTKHIQSHVLSPSLVMEACTMS